jgi:hypothetical protein
MPRRKEKKMKKNGLELLLLFAYGPVRKGICSKKSFAKKIEGILGGEPTLAKEIVHELPANLPRAWKHLLIIAAEMKKDPLDNEVVERYVFQVHNEDVMNNCAVLIGLPEVIEMEKRIIYLEADDHTVEKVRFLPYFDDRIGKGGKYFYHHGWLIAIDGPKSKK